MKVANVLGKRGEDLACAFLEKNGYIIVVRNIKVGRKELDIVAIHENMLIFIEVKTRSSVTFGTPLESIGHTKLKRIIHAAQLYAAWHQKLPQLLRIDAIEVFFERGNTEAEITHHKNITY